MSYRIAYTATAEEDVQKTLNCEKRSQTSAWSWLAALKKVNGKLKADAKQFPLAVESYAFPYEVRQLVFLVFINRLYRALFCIDGDVVYVLAVREYDSATPNELGSPILL